MKYSSAVGFRRALEQHLKVRCEGDGARIARDRKRIAFDRLLARLTTLSPDSWVLKGGFALELRLSGRARTTKDIDLAWQSSQDEFADALSEATICDLGDFFTFNVERTNDSSDRFGGAHRFRVTAVLAERTFENFLLDVGYDNNQVTTAELLITPNLLSFAGIDPVAVPAVSLAQQIAEKLHAYSRIYEGGRVSTRTKDLVDIVLVAKMFSLDAAALCLAVKETFMKRAAHEPPLALPAPPDQWRTPFKQLGHTVGLEVELEVGYATAAALLDPILQHQVISGTWLPDELNWR